MSTKAKNRPTRLREQQIITTSSFNVAPIQSRYWDGEISATPEQQRLLFAEMTFGPEKGKWLARETPALALQNHRKDETDQNPPSASNEPQLAIGGRRRERRCHE